MNDFYPQKVYRCDCLDDVITCDDQTLSDIRKKVKQRTKKVYQTDEDKVYCVKCGENDRDLVISCVSHLPNDIFVVEELCTNNAILVDIDKCFLKCIENYLRDNYYQFDFVQVQK